MKHIVLYALILMLVGVVCSVGVALVYVAAREPIEANKKATIDASMADIFGPEASVEEIAGAKKDADKVWKATGAGGETVGYAAIGAAQGYSSELKVLTGVTPDLATAIGIRVLEQQETPGLGAQVAEKPATQTFFEAVGGVFGIGEKPDPAEAPVFSAYEQQYVGKDLVQCEVVTQGSPDADEKIEAITAATITSKATNDAMKNAVEKIRRHLEKSGTGGTEN